jgi:protein involved in polysaccharide export with SLBB domain
MSSRAILISPAPLLRRLIIASALFGLLLLNVLMAAQAEGITGQLHFAEGTYRINVGDVLSLNVYNQSDLSSTSILVRSDGNASFNGVGEVQVAGKTIREASQIIEGQLRELVRDPKVSLTVAESTPPTVYLAGAVVHPGMLQAGNAHTTSTTESESNKGGSNAASTSRMDFRLSNVLSAAGGVKLTADLANVIITRDGHPYRTVNLWNMLKQGDTDQDMMLQNGDSVYIPDLPEQALDDATYQLLLSSTVGPRTFPVRIIGEVKLPGVYELNGTSPFLNSAIAKGGGYNLGANRKVIAIRRFTGETKFSTLYVDPNKFDFTLRPNDVVYVSELKTYETGRFAENASRILSPFSSLTSTIFSFALFKNNF